MNRYLDEWIRTKHGIRNREGLDKYIGNRIRKEMDYARENSSWYGRMLKGISSLEEAPFITEQDLRQHGNEMVCVSDSLIARVVTTSGTLGIPKRVYFTEEDQEQTIDYFSNGLKFVLDRDDKVYVLFKGENQGSLVRLLEEAIHRIGAETVTSIAKDVTCIIGSPGDVQTCSRMMLKNVKAVLLSSEYVSEECVNEIKKNLHCEVFEHYGMTEMGLGCAVSCGQRGYHIRECDIYIEIIDPVTKESLPDGAWGEVVFTTLGRKAMPFIRYRTGDISRIIKEECPCGSILRRLDKVKER